MSVLPVFGIPLPAQKRSPQYHAYRYTRSLLSGWPAEQPSQQYTDINSCKDTCLCFTVSYIRVSLFESVHCMYFHVSDVCAESVWG